MTPSEEVLAVHALNQLSYSLHAAQVKAGWYKDPRTGRKIEKDPMAMLMLVVTEVAEAAEGHRKDLMDDKLPHRKMIEVELADTMIRIFDIAGYLNLDLGNALVEKCRYNAIREDHKLVNRAKEGGKSC